MTDESDTTPMSRDEILDSIRVSLEDKKTPMDGIAALRTRPVPRENIAHMIRFSDPAHTPDDVLDGETSGRDEDQAAPDSEEFEVLDADVLELVEDEEGEEGEEGERGESPRSRVRSAVYVSETTLGPDSQLATSALDRSSIRAFVEQDEEYHRARAARGESTEDDEDASKVAIQAFDFAASLAPDSAKMARSELITDVDRSLLPVRSSERDEELERARLRDEEAARHQATPGALARRRAQWSGLAVLGALALLVLIVLAIFVSLAI